MKSPYSLRSFLWFLFLLGFGFILLCLEDCIITMRQPRPGMNKQLATETEDVSDVVSVFQSLIFGNSKPPVINLQQSTSAADRAPAGWEEQQQQLRNEQELRLTLLAKMCTKYQLGYAEQTVSKKYLSKIYVEDRYGLLYCEVPKVGCSNWKRVLQVLAGIVTSVSNVKNVHGNKDLHLLVQYDSDGINKRLKNYTKVLFVRDPFQRLVSAHRNKFMEENDYYHRGLGRRIIARYRANPSEDALRTGDGVTFREFVQYLLDKEHPPGKDPHWEPMSNLCHPCVLHYDFIGKFENVNSEANLLLRSIGAPQNLSYPDNFHKFDTHVKTSSSIVKEYYSQLNATERQGVYDIYRMDYLLFGYPKPFPDLY